MNVNPGLGQRILLFAAWSDSAGNLLLGFFLVLASGRSSNLLVLGN